MFNNAMFIICSI